MEDGGDILTLRLPYVEDNVVIVMEEDNLWVADALVIAVRTVNSECFIGRSA